MYAIDWASLLGRAGRRRPGTGQAARWLPAVSRTVWVLGWTSLLTDISSEMVASILPLYLVVQMGMQPFAYGIIDGLYQGSAALVRVLAGVVADRSRRYKAVATFGYGLSAVCRIALLLAGAAWSSIAAIVAVDRIGKGIRTAPRDALISLRSAPEDLATAFGVHRSMDAAGAMLGPFLAFVLLARMPGRFDVIFAAGFFVAALGVATIGLFMEPVTALEAQPAAKSARATATRPIQAPYFRAIVICGFLLALPTVSDGFIYLTLERQTHIGAAAFPLYFVGASLFTAMFSVPLGRAADKLGRSTVLFAGYGLLACVYVVLLTGGGHTAAMLAALALLGAYYAATDGVLTAMGAAVLPADATGTGLSYLATATNVGRVIASASFGLLWATAGLTTALSTYLAALIVAITIAGVLLRSHRVRSMGLP
jgi:MFS family permease